MQVSVADAQSQLPDFVRRAEAGEEIVLTRYGPPIGPTEAQQVEGDERWRRLEALQGSIQHTPGMESTTAANIHDFLYDERGLTA
ncbi:MAG: type II toxin-antitoxin system Phd/YefM family antitoxin [Sphingomonas sp.]|uniref:type II toxin-antitoxin system Phd/YefM family antitoxin n=1 Tax=Sphingomonas sp. TaxID=28214 RepID=UPI0030F979CB